MTTFLWVIVVLIGAVIGSFLNVLIYRGPAMWGLVEAEDGPRGSLIGPRSYCPHCRTKIPSWRLIPVVSFLLQRGRCLHCKGKISPRYPLVELGGMLVSVAAFWYFGFSLAGVFAAIYGWALIALAAIDWETGFLPDWVTLPLIIFGFTANLTGLFVPLTDAFIGAVAGYLVFRIIGAAFFYSRGYDGLGQGDAKLLAGFGAWMGWQMLPLVIFAGSLFTLAAVLYLRLTTKSLTHATPIAFGPGLSLAGFAGLFVQARIGLFYA